MFFLLWGLISHSRKLVKLPPPPPGGYSQWQPQIVARRERKYRAPANNQFYILDNSPGDIPKDRPRDILNLRKLILPIMTILYFGLSIALFVSNIRVQTKVSNQTTTILIRSIVTLTRRPPQRYLKNRNEKRINTRIAHAIKPNRVYKPVFQK